MRRWGTSGLVALMLVFAVACEPHERRPGQWLKIGDKIYPRVASLVTDGPGERVIA